MNQSENINELATALAKAQSEIRNAEEDKSNPHFKSQYATLASIWQACREPLSKNGLSIVQKSDMEDGKPVFVTLLLHSSGQWIRSSFPISPSLKIQETGSQITYLRRYFLSSMTGVAPGEVLDDDDDGERAMSRNKVTAPKLPETPASSAPMISKDEIVVLQQLLSNVPEEVSKNFWSLVKGKGIKTYETIPRSIFLAQKPLLMEAISKEDEVPF